MNADSLADGITRFIDGDRDFETEASVIILCEVALMARVWLKGQLKR